MNRTAALLLAAAVLVAAQSERPRPTRTAVPASVPTSPVTAPGAERSPVPRAAVAALEAAFDAKVHKFNATDPVEILSSTQGVYLEGFGAIFTSQVDLIMTPAPNPFRQVMSKEDVVRVRARKLERLPVVKQMMREWLAEAATALANMPPGEHLAIAVTLFRFGWEDARGLPSQIVMQASREKLLSRAAAESAIQVQEF